MHVIPLGWGARCAGRSEGIFSYVRLEQRVPADHPLRAIRDLVDAALKDLSRDFGRLYTRHDRPSIPPERLLRALLLQGVLYSALGTAADGAARLQSVVPLVRRFVD